MTKGKIIEGWEEKIRKLQDFLQGCILRLERLNQKPSSFQRRLEDIFESFEREKWDINVLYGELSMLINDIEIILCQPEQKLNK